MVLKIGNRYIGLHYLVLAEDADPAAPVPRAMRVVMSDGIAIHLDPDDAQTLRRRLDGLSGAPPAVPPGPGQPLPSAVFPNDQPVPLPGSGESSLQG